MKVCIFNPIFFWIHLGSRVKDYGLSIINSTNMCAWMKTLKKRLKILT